MKRNKEYIWFDRGYRQAISDKKVESFPAKFIGLGFVVSVSFFEPMLSLAAFLMWSGFEYFEWREEKKYGVDYDVPSQWDS